MGPTCRSRVLLVHLQHPHRLSPLEASQLLQYVEEGEGRRAEGGVAAEKSGWTRYTLALDCVFALLLQRPNLPSPFLPMLQTCTNMYGAAVLWGRPDSGRDYEE